MLVAAAASGRTFLGSLYRYFLGSALVMSSFIETGMPKGWSNTAGGVGAALLGVGAAIGLTPELVSYTEKHPEWAFPVVFLFLSFLMFVLVRMFRGGSRPKVPEHPK